MKFKLLEQNPIPTLAEMVAFCKHFIAIRADNIDKMEEQPLTGFSTGISCINCEPKLQQSLSEKDSTIDTLATVVQCFFCGEMGHTARKCPEKRDKILIAKREQEQFDRSKCTLCQGTGHFASQCANNWTMNKNFSSQSDVVNVSVPLNYQEVPHQ